MPAPSLRDEVERGTALLETLHREERQPKGAERGAGLPAREALVHHTLSFMAALLSYGRQGGDRPGATPGMQSYQLVSLLSLWLAAHVRPSAEVEATLLRAAMAASSPSADWWWWWYEHRAEGLEGLARPFLLPPPATAEAHVTPEGLHRVWFPGRSTAASREGWRLPVPEDPWDEALAYATRLLHGGEDEAEAVEETRGGNDAAAPLRARSFVVPVSETFIDRLLCLQSEACLGAAELRLGEALRTRRSIPLAAATFSCRGEGGAHPVTWALREALPFVVACLLRASGAARRAMDSFHSAEASRLLTGSIRPALLGLYGPMDGAGLDVDARVELSTDVLRVTAGVGMIATAAIPPGTRLATERPLAAWWRATGVDGVSSPPSTRKALEDLWRPRLLSLFEEAERYWDTVARGEDGDGSTAGNAHERLATAPPTITAYLRILAQLPAVEATEPATRLPLLEEILSRVGAEPHTAMTVWHEEAYTMDVSAETSDDDEAAATREAASPLFGTDGAVGQVWTYWMRHLNHACAPNAWLVWEPPASLSPSERAETGMDAPAIHLVALRDLVAGEEITLSYLPSPFVSGAEKRRAMGFACACAWCAARGGLVEGMVCLDCGEVIDGRGPVPAAPYRHAPCCTQRDVDYAGLARATSRRVTAAMHRLTTRARADLARRSARPACPAEAPDPAAHCVRGLLDVEACVQATLLPMHLTRLRLRQAILWWSTRASGLHRVDVERLLPVVGELVEDVGLLLSAHHPLRTRLRMYDVLLRGRQCAARLEADGGEGGTAPTSSCCGAVHDVEALTRRPFVVDPVIRTGILQSFQEHYVQCIAWRGTGAVAAEEAPVTRFFTRFAVELTAAGVDSVDLLDVLSLLVEEETRAGERGGGG